MKQLTTLLVLLFASIMAVAQENKWVVPEEIEPINVPFEMPQLQRPVFPNTTLNIAKNGAKQGKLSTKAIQQCIDKLSKKGGGTVLVPKGSWLTGRLTLKDNINLHIEEGAELHFSGEVKDYLPVVACRNEGVDIFGPGAMIYADGAENIAITGKGQLVAPSRDCELLKLTMGGIPEAVQQMPLKERIFDGSKGKGSLCLPVFIGPINCKNILIEGVTLVKSVFWNIVPVYSENIIIRDVTVSSAGIARTDGIDIDSSVNALIEYTSLDCGDDCFTLKAGRGMDGLTKARPTENVVIRHCYAGEGAGGLTIGSETAAMIRNVYMEDVTIGSPMYGIYFKTRRPRGGGGENMWFKNIRMIEPRSRAIYWDMLGSRAYVGKLAERHNTDYDLRLTPKYRNIHFEDLHVEKCKDFIKAIGLPESPIDDITFKNVTSGGSQRITLQDVGHYEFE